MAHWTTYRRDPRDPVRPGTWESVPEEAARRVHARIPELLRRAMLLPQGARFRVLRVPLPFLPGHHLHEFVALDVWPPHPWYVVDGPDGTQLLDGTRDTLQPLAGFGSFRLDASGVPDYLHFLLAHMPGSQGRFLVVESDRVPWRESATDADRERFASCLTPLTVEEAPEGFEVDACLLSGNRLARYRIQVGAGGEVALVRQAVLQEQLPILPDWPTDAVYAGKPELDHEAGWHVPGELPPALRVHLEASADLAEALEEDRIAWRYLPFFEGVALVRVLPEQEADEGRAARGLLSARGIFPLPGDSTPIHEAIERETFRLDDASLIDYLHFFCNHVHADEGPFRVVTEVDALNVRCPPGGNGPPDPDRCPHRYDRLTPGLLAQLIAPTLVRADRGQGVWHCSALNQYGGMLYRNRFSVHSSGEIEMTEDEPLVDGIPFDPERNRILTWIQVPPDRGSAFGAAGRTSVASQDAEGHRPDYLEDRRLEASILDEYVRLHLIQALREGQGAPLFSAQEDEDDEALLERLAGFVYSACPVVLLESPLAYVEERIAELLRVRAGVESRLQQAEGALYDESRCVFPELEDGDTLTVSLHQWHGILRPEAAAYRLGITDAPTFIGCDTPAVVPEPLRRVLDMHLCLGAVEDGLFRKLFCRLFDCDWPDMAADDGLWQRYVTPGDFYQPVREMLVRRKDGNGGDWTPAGALAAVRDRVRARLSEIGQDEGPGLAALHGLGEARVLLEDLLVDLRAAVAGEIPWNAVDRGLLLVGEPGVGKTLLARALARDCGVRFLHASEARWIAGTDGLAEHLLALRSTFAEARRSTPCILFIDELDSIGNRQEFEGRNRDYCTQIVNALLQELQGTFDRPGVFVIGATNHLQHVDPALTRAGRLDQVVHIPRPDRTALEGILRFHLEPWACKERLDADVDPGLLAGMALGATGADIAFFVRDAARRARKEGVRLAQRHLMAAITRTPRDRRDVQRLTPAEQARTAVHEAGHALALLLCDHYPARLSVISIVPRSDGSLGFTGSLPEECRLLTRKACEEYLGVLLAGRAAELLVYGEAGLSSGAGGPSEGSDLALATRWAARMLFRFGFGDEGDLRWRAEPETGADVARIHTLLARCHEEISAALQRHEALLLALRDALVDASELQAPAVYRLAEAHGLSPLHAGRKA